MGESKNSKDGEQSEGTPIFVPVKEENEDFSPIRILENTLVGIVLFAGRYLKTTWYLCVAPSRIAESIGTEHLGVAVSRPLSYLMISALPASYLVTVFLVFLEKGSDDFLAIGQEVVGDLSLSALLLTELPLIFVVLLYALGVGALFAKSNQSKKRRLVLVIFYVAGFQCVVSLFVLLSVFAFQAILLSVEAESLNRVFSIFTAVVVFLYTLALNVPAWLISQALRTGSAHRSWSLGGFARYCLSLLISIILYVAIISTVVGVLAATQSIVQREFYLRCISLGPVKTVGDDVEMKIAVFNLSPNLYLLDLAGPGAIQFGIQHLKKKLRQAIGSAPSISFSIVNAGQTDTITLKANDVEVVRIRYLRKNLERVKSLFFQAAESQGISVFQIVPHSLSFTVVTMKAPFGPTVGTCDIRFINLFPGLDPVS